MSGPLAYRRLLKRHTAITIQLKRRDRRPFDRSMQAGHSRRQSSKLYCAGDDRAIQMYIEP